MPRKNSREALRAQTLYPAIERLLQSREPRIERPSRYIGSEWVGGEDAITDTEVGQDAANFAFCMVYPDTYELGQPNQALRILVNAVNATDGLYAERGFLPASDMITAMRNADVAAFSLESCAPLSAFDAIGITLPHELAATNVLELLDLAGVPILAEDRSEEDPIIIGGGPCAFNPEPYARFFDVISIGEGEESIPELLTALRECRDADISREDTLAEVAKIPGNYVPSLYRESTAEERASTGLPVTHVQDAVPPIVEKRIFEGFVSSDPFDPMVVPYMEIVHDRLNVEILRGCARGCRFCQAGMMYRPVRERSADAIVDAVKRGIAETGYEEVSLTSLSSTDHSQIDEILTRLNSEFEDSGVRISIPSQRLDAFGVDMASLVAGRKKGGLTFAPEAGTQRLRDVINKNVTDEDLMSATRAAIEAGWTRMKLYFMIGLPTEEDADLQGIADMANRAYEVMKEACPKDKRGSLSLSLSINVFVPKAQTPFQWDAQIDSEEAARRVSVIRKALKYRAIQVSYHEPKTSLIEAVMSRGGREVGLLIKEAWKRGAKFDAWTEHFNADAWAEAAEVTGVDMDEIAHASHSSDAIMPWEHISCGVSHDYLVEEREKAYDQITTPDCTFRGCTLCGVCPDLHVSNELASVRVGATRV